MQILNHADLKPYNTYRIGGTVWKMAFPETREDFVELTKLAEGKPIMIQGGGANMVFNDGLFDALFVNTTKWRGISAVEHEGKAAIALKGGTYLPELVAYVRQQQLANYDFLAGIPGTIGGAVFMNAGAWRHYIEQDVLEVELFDLKSNTFRTLKKDQLTFGYRHQTFVAPGEIVVSTVLDASQLDPEVGDKILDILKTRLSKHPHEPSCGSFFKNPPGNPCGQLIEDCGLKGKQIGGIQVSPKHGNFLVNTGGGTFKDLMTLAKLVQDEVRTQKHLELEPEVWIIEDTKHPRFYQTLPRQPNPSLIAMDAI